MNPLQIQERLDVLSDHRLPLTERINLVSTLVSTQRLNRYNVGKLGNRLGKLKELNRKIARNGVIKTETSGLLEHLANQIPHIHGFTGQEIGNALYGLQNLDYRVVPKELLSAIADKIPNTDNLDGQAVGNALYGLRNLDCRTVPKELLSAIADRIPDVDDLNGQAIGNALYGLQNLDYRTVPKVLLSAIADKIPDIDDFKAQEIGNALYGLQNLDCRVVPKELLSAIADKIPDIYNFTGQEIGNALYGLQNLDYRTVPKELLSVIADKIPDIDKLDGQAIGNALYGLQNLDYRAMPKELLSAMADKMPDIDNFTGQHIGNALYGLFAFRNNASAKQMVEMLFGLAAVPSAEENMQANDRDIFALLQAFSFYHRKLPDWLADKCEKFFAGNLSPDSQNIMGRIIMRHIQSNYPEISAKYSGYVCGFVMDVYLPERRVNIELDNVLNHSRKQEKLFEKRRDKYLKSEQISVHRIKYRDSRDRDSVKEQVDAILRNACRSLANHR